MVYKAAPPSRELWVMWSLPCSSSQRRLQSSCSSSFSSVSQSGCSQTPPGGQHITTQFNDLMTSDEPIDRRQMFYYQWAHRGTMSSFLQLRDFSGERTNQIMRSITVVIRAIHLQKEEEISCNCWRFYWLLWLKLDSDWWNLQWPVEVAAAERL